MAIAYKVYKDLPFDNNLISTPNVPYVDFGLLVIAKFLEPHAITWYNKATAGTMLF